MTAENSNTIEARIGMYNISYMLPLYAASTVSQTPPSLNIGSGICLMIYKAQFRNVYRWSQQIKLNKLNSKFSSGSSRGSFEAKRSGVVSVPHATKGLLRMLKMC